MTTEEEQQLRETQQQVLLLREKLQEMRDVFNRTNEWVFVETEKWKTIPLPEIKPVVLPPVVIPPVVVPPPPVVIPPVVPPPSDLSLYIRKDSPEIEALMYQIGKILVKRGSLQALAAAREKLFFKLR